MYLRRICKESNKEYVSTMLFPVEKWTIKLPQNLPTYTDCFTIYVLSSPSIPQAFAFVVILSFSFLTFIFSVKFLCKLEILDGKK
jgi:hypothetical protein